MASSLESFPIIIACGSSEAEIEYYCIKLENHVFPVCKFSSICLLIHIIFYFMLFSEQLPVNFTFPEVFDIYYKVHKIFDLCFEPNLRNMMFFIENYIYKIEEGIKKPTNRMLDIFNQISA